jgi:protein SCO1
MAILVAVAVLCVGSPSAALPNRLPELGNKPTSDEVPRQLEGIGIEDKVGTDLPRDIALTDHEGRAVTTGDYLDGKRPLVVVLAYYECPMLCTLVLNALLKGMNDSELTAGTDYRVLTVSFDERDSVAAAKAKRDSYITAYQRGLPADGWDFAVGAPDQVKRLADAVGFSYRWDDQTEQFAHAAGVFVISPDGRLTRTLAGLELPGPTLELAIAEASRGKETHSALSGLLLFCYQYDPTAGSYVLATQRLMKAVGGVTALVLLAFLAWMFRGERLRKKLARSHRLAENSASHPVKS